MKHLESQDSLLEVARLCGLQGSRSQGPNARSGTEADYAGRMQSALGQINRPDYPAGMIPWLGEAHPDLYDELTSRIPDEINLAWKCRAPLAEFDAILVCLVETHRRACELYRKHLQKPPQGILAIRQGAEQAK